MPVPWEALIPFALLAGCLSAGGTLLKATKMWDNDGKPPRYSLDNWDVMMMERDKRLTGSFRGQRHETAAPAEFATSSEIRTGRISE